jgi:hypothetical protein
MKVFMRVGRVDGIKPRRTCASEFRRCARYRRPQVITSPGSGGVDGGIPAIAASYRWRLDETSSEKLRPRNYAKRHAVRRKEATRHDDGRKARGAEAVAGRYSSAASPPSINPEWWRYGTENQRVELVFVINSTRAARRISPLYAAISGA